LISNSQSSGDAVKREASVASGGDSASGNTAGTPAAGTASVALGTAGWAAGRRDPFTLPDEWSSTSAFAWRVDVAGLLQIWRTQKFALGPLGLKRIDSFRKRGLSGLRHGAALAEGCPSR